MGKKNVFKLLTYLFMIACIAASIPLKSCCCFLIIIIESQGFEAGQHIVRLQRSRTYRRFWNVQTSDILGQNGGYILWHARLHGARGETLFVHIAS